MGATLSAPPPPPPPPPDFAHTLFFVSAFYLAVLLLHVLLPGPRVEGYVCDWRGRVLTYKLNGFLLYLCTLGGFWYGGLPEELTTYAAVNWWQSVKAANVLGLGGALLLTGLTLEPPFRALTSDQKELCKRAAKGEDIMGAVTPAPQRNVAAHYFFGKAFNPRLLGIDLKMLLYALGAAALTWNLCSALALRISTHRALSNALVLYSAMLLWFVGEYMLLEVIHLYTYDLMCEKLGFKLCWGCLVFYPYLPYWRVATVLDAPAGAVRTTTIVAIAFSRDGSHTRRQRPEVSIQDAGRAEGERAHGWAEHGSGTVDAAAMLGLLGHLATRKLPRRDSAGDGTCTARLSPRDHDLLPDLALALPALLRRSFCPSPDR